METGVWRPLLILDNAKSDNGPMAVPPFFPPSLCHTSLLTDMPDSQLQVLHLNFLFHFFFLSVIPISFHLLLLLGAAAQDTPGYARMLWHFCVKINENLFALCYGAQAANCRV